MCLGAESQRGLTGQTKVAGTIRLAQDTQSKRQKMKSFVCDCDVMEGEVTKCLQGGPFMKSEPK